GSSSKVLMDSEGSGNLLYLPIDKLMNQPGGPSATPALPPGRAQSSSSGAGATNASSNNRLRTRDR
ncbi:MAG: protease modulator HflK, partial [Pseudomonadota bacterium]